MGGIEKPKTILRQYESKNGCELCGEFHVLSYGGKYYCRDKDHFAHGPGWDEPPFEPMSDEELRELHNQIVAEKDANYPGGYAKWCADRGIKK